MRCWVPPLRGPLSCRPWLRERGLPPVGLRPWQRRERLLEGLRKAGLAEWRLRLASVVARAVGIALPTLDPACRLLAEEDMTDPRPGSPPQARRSR